MPAIVIGIAFHNKSQPLVRAVISALAQKVPGHDVYVVVLDSSPSAVAHAMLKHLSKKFWVVRGKARTAYAARNFLIRYAEQRWPSLAWHVRLDADDCFSSTKALAVVLSGAKPMHRVLLAGNRQMGVRGELIGRNIPSVKMLRRRYLLGRLAKMAKGVFKAELPSCNLILRARLGWRYPAKKSAEDHWMVAMILLKSAPRWVRIRETVLIDYRLGGELTKANKIGGNYLAQRKALFEAAKSWHRHA